LSLASLSGPVPLIFSRALRFCVTQPRPLLRLRAPLYCNLTSLLWACPPGVSLSPAPLSGPVPRLFSLALRFCVTYPDLCSDCAPAHGRLPSIYPPCYRRAPWPPRPLPPAERRLSKTVMQLLFWGGRSGRGGGGMFGVSVKNLCRRRLPSLTPLPIQCPTP